MKRLLLSVVYGCAVFLLPAHSTGDTMPICSWAVKGACCTSTSYGGCMLGEGYHCNCDKIGEFGLTCGCNANHGRNDLLLSQNHSLRSECRVVGAPMFCCSTESFSWYCKKRYDCVPYLQGYCSYYGQGCWPPYDWCVVVEQNNPDACPCNKKAEMGQTECFNAGEDCKPK